MQSKPPILFDLIRTTLSSCRANGYAEIYRYFGVYQSHSAIAIITKLKCFVEFAMALIWRKHLSVGNAMLDSEHKNLIGIVNCIEYAINTKDSNALLKTIRSLKDCADTHFSNEVRFMRALNIPMAQHELVHQHLQKELQQTIDELVVKGNTWTEYAMDYYSQLLMDWLIEHINTEDMLMKPVLESHPYDFKPV